MFCILVLESMSHSVTFLFQSDVTCFSILICCIMFKNFFFLNNQPDALIKTLHVSGNFSAHHQEFSTVHLALVCFMQVSDNCFHVESGCSILTLHGSSHQKPA